MGRATAARERWEAMTPSQQRERVAKLQAGRRRARGPEALAEVEGKIDALGEEFKGLPRGDQRRVEILHELRPLGRRRAAIKYGSEEPA